MQNINYIQIDSKYIETVTKRKKKEEKIKEVCVSIEQASNLNFLLLMIVNRLQFENNSHLGK